MGSRRPSVPDSIVLLRVEVDRLAGAQKLDRDEQRRQRDNCRRDERRPAESKSDGADLGDEHVCGTRRRVKAGLASSRHLLR